MSEQPLDEQRRALTEAAAARIAAAVDHAEPPGPLYGLVLAHSLGEFYAYVWPLYDITRAALLQAGADAHGLWDPSWADAERLPPGVPEELRERNIEVPLYEDNQLDAAFWRYCGGPPDNDAVYDAIERLWLDIAAALTSYAWAGHVEVTDDYVALAHPMEGSDAEIRAGLEHSLGPERFREFEARGWVPG